MPRRAVAVAVAFLLLVAGCSGAGPLPGGESGPQTTTLEPADPVYETPLDESGLVADHIAALRDAETVTFVMNSTLSDSHDASYASRDVLRIRLSDGAMYRTERGDLVVQTYRFGNGTAFHRANTEAGVEYSRHRTRESRSHRLVRDSASHPLELFAFEHVGVATRDGERVHVYRASGPDSLNVSAVTSPSLDGEATAYAANATLHVRPDGLVTYVDFSYQVGTEDHKRTVERTLRVTDLGETDVSPPAWLDAARAETGNASETRG